MHLFRIHALLLAHSELIKHSGLQFGGEPMKFDKQEHDGTPLLFLHWAFRPHGDGTQGSRSSSLGGGVAGGAI